MQTSTFFGSAQVRQPINQWLCIALISLMCFWTVLYYFTHKAEAIGESYAADFASQKAELHSAHK